MCCGKWRTMWRTMCMSVVSRVIKSLRSRDRQLNPPWELKSHLASASKVVIKGSREHQILYPPVHSNTGIFQSTVKVVTRITCWVHNHRLYLERIQNFTIMNLEVVYFTLLICIKLKPFANHIPHTTHHTHHFDAEQRYSLLIRYWKPLATRHS